MNGLTLRINKIGTKRSKNTGFDVIVFSDSTDIQDDHKPYYNSIIQVTTPEEQLSVIKELLNSSQTNYDKVFASILVDVFLQANAKHPIKCFLTRHITKNLHLQEAFTKNLVCKLSKYVFKQYKNYKEYVENVMKIAGCTENFPTGTKALHALEIPLIYFFKDCLESCIKQLRISTDISPTEKSEIFNLTHLTLRLLLQIIQKINKCAVIQLEDIFSVLRSIFMYLLFEHEVPMDTKSLCGIVYLTIHMLENGSDSWLSYLTNQDSPDDAVQLAMLSAIVIIVPINKLESEKVNNLPAIVVLCDNILKIGERSSSESIFILGVSRTILQISKLLPEITQLQIGLLLVDELLMYVWTHSEHYMDSVRHLAAQTMGCIVKYCNKLQMQGVNKALTQLFTALSTLDRSRKSYYLCLTSLVEVMGSQAVIQRLPDVMEIIVQAVKLQAVQASATTALETIIEKHAQENKQNISEAVIAPLLNRIQQDDVESTELSVLEGLLVKAVKIDSKVMDFILPHIENHSGNLKSVLTLLSVARKANVTEMLSNEQTDSLWKGIISYDVLKQAAVDYQDEVRILSLSLIVNSPKSTESFSRGDLDLILWYLKYNINAQSPNFRQLFLSILKKFMKRFEDSYKVVKRQVTVCQGNKDHYYITFVEELRSFCFDSLLQGTNYSRRFVALQILVWVENIHLEETERIWKETYVEKLLVHLEDSYENNKAMALEVLQHCPAHILQEQTYSTVLDLESILRQASSTKPTDCVSAGYKLVLLIKLLPQNILRDRELCSEPEAVTYTLINILLKKLEEELSICKSSVCDASRRAPMYGVISCVRRCFQLVDTEAISSSALWTSLISSLIKTCLSVCSSVECVVNNTSPEGHLPMDGGIVDDWGNSKGLTLEDGRLVTAQMVLLCAWRSVKEASLLLGDLTSRLSIPESLSYEELGVIEAHFTNLLMNTKHRGAFEQVYVGYTRFLSRVWHCPNSALVSSAQSQLQNILDAVRNKDEGLCATRRSAGLPFMIQALLTTSLTTHNNSKHTNDIMSSLLELSRHPDLSSRSHALNVLRALFRNTELTQSISGFVGEALVVALEGFRSGSWMERNSSTLLFSALMTRTFGVQRSRDPDDLCIRNRMTGRIFFLRYPQLYDYMLNKLSEVSASESQLLRPALYPILLLLARLYPSSLEGTVSNLKLAAFIPHILSCAGSCVLKTRQLAAKAIVPLVAPDQYISHVESMFELLHDKGVKKNLCHGILLQITSLLNAKPDCLTPKSVTISRLSDVVQKTGWIVEPEQLQRPCYLILDEYMKVINLLLWRFPSTFTELLLSKIDLFIQSLLFTNKHCPVNSGRDICLANAAYLGFVVMNKYGKMNIAKEFLYKCLEHESYEVNLAAMNYLLIAHKSIEPDHCIYQKHLQTIKSDNILAEINEHEKYLELLCNVLKDNQYLECIRKSLKLLTLQNYTQRHIVAVQSKVDIEITDKIIIQVLFDCIEKEHENLTHIYLQSLTDFVSEKIQEFNLRDIGEELLLKVIRVIFACSSSENNDDIRSVVVDFMERNFVKLVNYEFKELCDVEEFEFKATLLSTIISTLEDDDSCLRERSSKIISKLVQLSKTEVICSKAGEYLREYVVKNFGKNYCIALMLILALLDFKSEVCLTDEINDECRVFDQSERYNIYLEETIWTNVCADIIIDLCNKTHEKLVDAVRTITNNKMYRPVIAKLCGTNFILFENILDGAEVVKSDAINPKISLFVKRIIC